MDRKFWETGWPGKAWWGVGGRGDFEPRLKGIGGAARHEAEKTFGQREQQEVECVWWQCPDPHLSHTSEATQPVKSREASKNK